MSTDIVIVGGGLAAASAAEELRTRGFDGGIKLIGAERHHPYLRPPLTKGYLTGADELSSVFVQPDQWYDEKNVDLVLGTRVSQLDPGSHQVILDTGAKVPYGSVLLATGASPRHLKVPGSDAAGIYYLRTLDESTELRDALKAGDKHVVIVGSSWIGLEVAAAARGYGNTVDVMGMEEVPLSGPLGVELGRVFGKLHTDNGVTLHLPALLRSYETRDGRVTGVVTDTETLPADFVVVGAGAIPNVEVPQQAGLTIQNGVLADEHMRTEAPDVYVAGDIANTTHPFVGEHLRNEHWANAIGGGKAAAANMAGQATVYDEIPYFYTDQYDLGMEYSGFGKLTVGAEVLYRGNLEAREFIAFWLREGKVVAGMNVNIWDVNDDIKALISSRRTVSADRLRDASVPLAEV